MHILEEILSASEIRWDYLTGHLSLNLSTTRLLLLRTPLLGVSVRCFVANMALPGQMFALVATRAVN